MPSTKSLTEVVMVAHLRSPINISILDAASWAKAFENEFNLPQQMSPASPFNLESLPGQPLIAMANPLEIPRLVLRSAKSPFIVQLQSDRFALSWARTKSIGEDEIYVGFEDLKALWIKQFEIYCKWYNSVFNASPDVMGAELMYTNALPLLKDDGSARRLSEIFKFVTPGSRPVNAFSTTWAELLHPDPGSPRVSALVGIGVNPLTGQNAMFYNFTGVGVVEPGGGNPLLLEMFDALHDRINEMHLSSINAV